MPASSRPFRSALIRDEGSTRSAPPSTPMSLSADGWMQVASFIVFTASLLGPSVASPGLLERLALLAGSAWVVVYAQQLRRTLSVNRHEFERNLVAA